MVSGRASIIGSGGPTIPIHDWSRIPAGLFHDFHQSWCIYIKTALNSGLLPKGLSALVGQRAGSREGDVLTIESWSRSLETGPEGTGGLLTVEAPQTSIVRASEREIYAERASRIVVRHHLGRIVAAIEIVSPGNKDSKASLREFVDKALDFLREGVHLLVVDLFPPTPRDPFGIHKAVWDEICEEEFRISAGKDRILASYEAGEVRSAYVEPIGVGDVLPAMPLFLLPGVHLKVPLESTYQNAWHSCPEEMKHAVVTGILPEAQPGRPTNGE